MKSIWFQFCRFSSSTTYFSGSYEKYSYSIVNSKEIKLLISLYIFEDFLREKQKLIQRKEKENYLYI
jgi:hypothetical protein